MPVKHFILHFKTEETCFAELLLLFFFFFAISFRKSNEARNDPFSEDIQVDQHHQPNSYIISPNHRW